MLLFFPPCCFSLSSLPLLHLHLGIAATYSGLEFFSPAVLPLISLPAQTDEARQGSHKKRGFHNLLVWPPHLWFMRLRRKTRRKERLKWEGEELSEGSPELRPLEEGWGGYGWDRMGRTKTGTELKWLGCYLISQTTIFQQQSLSTPLWWSKIMQMEAPLQLQYSRKSK